MASRGGRALWWVVGLAGGVGVLGIGGFGLATAYLRRSLPSYEGTVVVPALRDRVVITWDEYGIPSITAASAHDLFLALGYVHAQDRRWQMDLARRVAQGRLAEAFGSRLVESDRFLRTIGLWRAAARADSSLSDDVREILQAYADGVNAGSANAGASAPEFLFLRLRPEPWTARHSIAVGKLMTWDLTEWDLSLALARAVDRVGPELAAELLPTVADWSPRIVPEAERRERRPDRRRVRPLAIAAHAPGEIVPEVPAPLRRLLDGFAIARASNSWVIGPSRSRSGKPILANDMHLPLRAPSIWYLAGLHGPGYDAVGMTLAGLPGIVAGHNRRVAWGFTAAMVDNVDFFLEETDPRDSTCYRTPTGWARMTVREETIQVRGGARPVVFQVAETRHGPVLPPGNTRLPNRVVAMAWTGAQATGEGRAVLRLNRAANVADVVAALREFGNPGVNVVFADADGNIGYWLAGVVPVRKSGDGVLPVPGASGQYDWVGTVPFESLPHTLNPRAGTIVTANNIPRDGGPYIGAHFFPGYRAARILELIESASTHDPVAVHDMQLDVYSLFAQRHLPLAVRAARVAGLHEAVALLEGWDRRARADSRAAALFYTWVERLRWAIASDEYGDTLGYFPWETLDRILTEGRSPWIDDRRTSEPETLDGIGARAMREAVDLVVNRTWGEIHTVTSEHPMGTARWLNAWLDLSVGPFPADGEPFTVNAAHHDGLRPPFEAGWGVSQRHVVDLADPDAAGGFILPTGQSGHPWSRHYADQSEAWRYGGLWTIPVERTRARAMARGQTILTPRAGSP